MNQFGKAQPKQSAYDTSTPYGQQPAYNAYAPPGQAPKPQNQAPSAPYSNEAEWEQWRSGQWQTPPVDDALRPGRDYYVPPGQNPYLSPAAYLPARPIADFRPQGPAQPFPVPQVTPQPGMQGGAAGWPGWAGQQQPAIDPVQAWEAYDREIAGQRRPLPGGGYVTDNRYIHRPPMARPGSAPSPYSNQEEYRRFMRENYPGYHTDRKLKQMVPWEFNPANPDRGEQRPDGMLSQAAFPAGQRR